MGGGGADGPAGEFGELASVEAVAQCHVAPVAGAEQTSAGGARSVLALLRGVGGDMGRLRLPPSFNLAQSQLELYGLAVYGCAQDLLGACDDARSPLERFLAVLRFHLSTTRQPTFGKAPYNPVLGETHHVSAGDLNVLLEQVSHHPPISALHATNEKKQLSMTWWHKAVPHFYGAWLGVDMVGSRTLSLHRHGETYELTSPCLAFQFIPTPSATWLGVTTVTCSQTRYEGTVSFKGKSFFGLHGSPNAVEGIVKDTRTGDTICKLSGKWDGQVFVTNVKTNKTQVLYDAAAALSNVPIAKIVNPTAVAASESMVVWRRLSAAIRGEDWPAARREKEAVEAAQRRERQRREREREKERGEGGQWAPRFFSLEEAEGGPQWAWRWGSKKKVPEAPIRVAAPREAAPVNWSTAG